ncbi:spx domain-containing [Trichoderma arundinaceum]|uniref:Spx domain-containing n=1 Tax=Trichoderma arundinaceum TaxID=490622 RepID=A0A395NF00_TRIAR|nr:spx domain-containing [Trichoderma arundinaceum]
MKYGDQLERESVPEWSLHNLDYNSLKHEIKVHTTRDQATALAIPGHQDTALRRFEDALYTELCHQHDRLDLFVVSKADEVSRRLDHIAASIKRFTAKSHNHHSDSPSASLRYQRKFIKYERELLRIREDIQALSRFANAQVVAFRKILKKYRKWTGSSSLSSRFNDEVLGNPRSFTRRSFTYLQERHDEIEEKLRHATPVFSEPSSPSSVDTPVAPSSHPSSSQRVSFDTLPPSCFDSQTKYWNEYDDGSDAGGPDDEYAIYVNPDQDSGFPGWSYAQTIVLFPFEKAKEWLGKRQPPERQPLFSSYSPGDSINQGYGSMTAVHTDSDEEEAYASSDGFPAHGYATHYALPSVGSQQLRHYRERVLFWGTLGCFAASFVFLGIAGILISTGRHKLRVEVDAGATVGAMVSLFCACSGLGMTLYREDRLALSYRLMVWATFIATCLLNGMLLILVLGNSP